jgi:hypothetical protein
VKVDVSVEIGISRTAPERALILKTTVEKKLRSGKTATRFAGWKSGQAVLVVDIDQRSCLSLMGDVIIALPRSDLKWWSE